MKTQSTTTQPRADASLSRELRGEAAHNLDTTGLPLVHGPYVGLYLVTQAHTPFGNFALATSKEDAEKIVLWGNSQARLTAELAQVSAENKAIREALGRIQRTDAESFGGDVARYHEWLTEFARAAIAAASGSRSASESSTNMEGR